MTRRGPPRDDYRAEMVRRRDIRTGAPAAFPVVVAAKTYQTRVVDDQVQIGVG